MIQIQTDSARAERFIEGMTRAGYTTVRVDGNLRIDYHFTKNGVTSINYTVTLYPDDDRDIAYIGIRPL